MRDIREMRIAIAVATTLEQEGLCLDKVQELGPHSLSAWVTGIGAMQAAHTLATCIGREHPGLVVQVGIAGAFDTERHPIGSTVCVERDCQADLGVMEVDGWNNLAEIGYSSSPTSPYKEGWLVNPYDALMNTPGLVRASGITVNQVSTDLSWIQHLRHRLNPAIESMEGAALHYVCLINDIPFIQIRGISNRVGERDKSKWQIHGALSHARASLQALIAGLPANEIL